MRKRFNTKKINYFLFHKVSITIFGLIIIVLISIPLAGNVSKQYEINKEIEQLRAEIDRLDNKNEDLKEMIDYLETDQFVDSRAREGLNFKLPGEEVVVIKDSAGSTTAVNGSIDGGQNIYGVPSQDINSKLNRKSNPQRWWFYFFESS